MSEAAGEAKDAVQEHLPSGNGGGLGRKILIPAAAGIGTLAATVAARKGPDLVRDKILPQLEKKGLEQAVSGGSRGGREKTRRLPIQRWTDVAVPVQEAYEKWTQFEDFPKFMHRVLSVRQDGDRRLEWEEKIWFSTRQWQGEITDRRKNDRIAWKTTKGTSHSGVVSFHKLDSNLTRVLVTVDFHPTGVLEKLASGLRFVKRAVEADLARFKAYCELGDAKGLEYAQPGELEHESRGESNSNGSQAGSKSDEERERSRHERAERREERRGS
jgi:uncharacterized membrane protein